MPKVKVPRKSTSIDMTAMTDVAFLLLTFFMLATKFKPDEPVQITTPSSISEIKLPETDVMLLSVDRTGRVLFGIDGQQNRIALLNRMAEKYQIKFTDAQRKEFSLMDQFGVSIKQLPQFLDMNAEQRKKVNLTGIPCDSTYNELGDWIWQARLVNNNIRVAIKADGDAKYPAIKQVISTVQDKKVNRFNLITSAEKPQD
jgi:biopolymer transport protein ExbD